MSRLVLILIWCPLFAADQYVRDGGSCTSGCTSWSNASDQITTALGNISRGDTIWVADGLYSGFTFSVSNSGTTRITIRKATIAAHGTETGWSDAYGDGQAAIGALGTTTGYLTIDGAVGGGPADWDCSECGFKFTGESSIGPVGTFTTTNLANSTIIAHSDLTAGASGPSDTRTLSIWDADDLTIQHSAIRDAGCDLISGNQMNNFLVEYSYLARNHQAEPGCHGDLLEYQITNASNFTFRFNFFEDIVGSYAFGSHDPTITGYYIYGNIFYWTSNPFFGNYLVGCLSGGGTLVNMKFYNNSLYGNFSGSNIGFGILNGSGHEARNNIYVHTGASFSIGFSSATTSGNTCYNQGSSCSQNLTGNPFTSVPTNFTLATASTAGTTLSSPYAVDLTGATRGADGTWDRGAYEYDLGMTIPKSKLGGGSRTGGGSRQ